MNDAQAAHLRLLSTLPVRTHEGTFSACAGRDSVQNYKEVVINGNHYRSLTEAARDLGICRDSVRKMITRGDGRFQ